MFKTFNDKELNSKTDNIPWLEMGEFPKLKTTLEGGEDEENECKD